MEVLVVSNKVQKGEGKYGVPVYLPNGKENPEYRKRWRAANRWKYREQEAAYSKKRIERRRYWVNRWQQAKGCELCGYNTSHYALHFDHINQDEKYKNIAELIGSQYKIATIISEIRKCRVLCANCHAVETFTKDQHLYRKDNV